MKNIFLIKLTILFVGCVGPSDPVHGLVENMPAIINTRQFIGRYRVRNS